MDYITPGQLKEQGVLHNKLVELEETPGKAGEAPEKRGEPQGGETPEKRGEPRAEKTGEAEFQIIIDWIDTKNEHKQRMSSQKTNIQRRNE